MITAEDLVGRKCEFDGLDGKRLTGHITAAEGGLFSEPGHIPDFLCTVVGASGAKKVVSMVDSHLTLPDR